MTSLLTGLALCCLLARAPPILLSFLSLSDNSRSQPQHTVAKEPVCARARMHGATATTAATTPMHFRAHTHTRTHTFARSRASSTDCDHCRSSTIPRLVPLALALRPPPPVAPFPHSATRSRSPHTTFYLSPTSRVFFVSRSPSSPTASLSLSTTLDISPAPPPPSRSSPPRTPPNTSLLHTPYTLLLFFRFTVSPASRSLSLFLSYILFRLFLVVLSFSPPSSVSLSTGLLPMAHTGQPAWFTVQFATLVPSLLLSPSFTRAQRTRCSRTGARECNV